MKKLVREHINEEEYSDKMKQIFRDAERIQHNEDSAAEVVSPKENKKYTFHKRKNRNNETMVFTDDNRIGGMLNDVDTMVLSFDSKKDQIQFEDYCNYFDIKYGHFFGSNDILAINNASDYFKII